MQTVPRHAVLRVHLISNPALPLMSSVSKNTPGEIPARAALLQTAFGMQEGR